MKTVSSDFFVLVFRDLAVYALLQMFEFMRLMSDFTPTRKVQEQLVTFCAFLL